MDLGIYSKDQLDLISRNVVFMIDDRTQLIASLSHGSHTHQVRSTKTTGLLGYARIENTQKCEGDIFSNG